jgi:L-rhamnose mutarotase
MTEVHLTKLKFKRESGKKDWLAWCDELKRRKEEVLTTLKNEGVHLEACFLSEEEDSVYYFIEVEDLNKAYAVFEKSKIPVDREHEKVKEYAFESEVRLKKLFDFHNKS